MKYFRKAVAPDYSYILVINTSTEEQTVDLTQGPNSVPYFGTILLRSITDSREETKAGYELLLKIKLNYYLLIKIFIISEFQYL